MCTVCTNNIMVFLLLLRSPVILHLIGMWSFSPFSSIWMDSVRFISSKILVIDIATPYINKKAQTNERSHIHRRKNGSWNFQMCSIRFFYFISIFCFAPHASYAPAIKFANGFLQPFNFMTLNIMDLSCVFFIVLRIAWWKLWERETKNVESKRKR